MKTVISIAAVLALSTSWSNGIADEFDLAGLKIAGQAIDGTLVLDDAVSGLENWETSGLAMPSSESIEGAPTLLVIGHVEGFDSETGVLTISGQQVTLAEGATVIDAPRDIEADLTADNLIWYLQEGRYVAVAGDTYGGGENLATHVVRLDNEAQPGTAPIYVRGSIDTVNDIQGVAYIGGMSFDLNTASSTSDYPAVGNVVEMLAYQSSPTNAIVSSYSSLERSTNSSRLAGITGSGAKPKGINGSGSKPRGITGSGSKPRGITGSGSKPRGITGSGSKPRGINGSGAKPKGITGSGSKPRGITGSGSKPRGITGSGAKPRGITGSGAKKR